jgi:hypothetical protein
MGTQQALMSSIRNHMLAGQSPVVGVAGGAMPAVAGVTQPVALNYPGMGCAGCQPSSNPTLPQAPSQASAANIGFRDIAPATGFPTWAKVLGALAALGIIVAIASFVARRR